MHAVHSDISHFFVSGINYRKTDAAIRGQFAIGPDQYTRLLELAPGFGLQELFIVSTCNRTEIYGFAENAGQLAALLCSQTEGSIETFQQLCYTHQGEKAVQHLFQVGAGLDSQILGDYEIVGQIKQAAKFAKQQQRIGVFTERLINSVLQASKAIKNQTELSGGTVSVSFAAVQYIRKHVTVIKEKKILIVGTGKMGRNTCRNMVDYLGTKNITLINRTEAKATVLATELGLKAAPMDSLASQIESSDIILVATNSSEHSITKAALTGNGKKWVIDLSIPNNVDPAAASLPGIKLVNVDALSKMKDETLAKREAEVPKARNILALHLEEFMEWYRMRKYVPVFKAVKTKLREIHTSSLSIPLYPHPGNGASADEKIQRVINGMASKMKEQNQQGCYYIEAINEFIATGTI